MNTVRSIKPTRRIQVLTTPSAPIRWDRALMMVLGLFGLMSQPARR